MKSRALNLIQGQTRCTARRKNGESCKNFAVLGAVVCRMHGGSAPQVKRAAQVRLAMATEALVQRLLHMADDESVPPAVRLAAIRDALDRANVVGTQELAVTATVKSWEQKFETRIVKVYDTPTLESDVIDAEVIEHDEAESEVQTRHDRRAFAEVDKARAARQRQKPKRNPRPAGTATPSAPPEPEVPDWYAEPPTRTNDAEWAERGRAEARRSATPNGKRKPGQKRR